MAPLRGKMSSAFFSHGNMMETWKDRSLNLSGGPSRMELHPEAVQDVTSVTQMV